jgi:hypothetical protein
MKKTTIKISFAATIIAVLYAFTTHKGGIYKSNTGKINFFSSTPVEDIKADNNKVKSAFNSENGDIQFSVLIKDFQFEKALMQEHFNENYMESNKYPKATFSGKIEKISSIDLHQKGTYKSKVSGKLKIKDITKEVSTNGTFTVKENHKVNGKATFIINPEDYNIKIPKVVSKKISREIEITVDVDYVH